MVGKAKKSGRCGHHISKPGTLEDQIIGDMYAKPTKRTKGSMSAMGTSKKQSVKITGVLSQLKTLQTETIDQEFRESEIKDEKKHTEKEEFEDEEFEVPEHMDTVLNDFQSSLDIKLTNDEQQIYAAFIVKTDASKSCVEQMKQTLLEQHAEIKTQIDEESNAGLPVFDEEVLQMFDCAADVLKNYRNGPLPKMIKTMPTLRNWIQLLYRTKPDEWSAAAMYQLTRIYRSQKPEMAQVFYSKVLLPRLRDDIAQYKKLNTHLYRALGESLFKCSAFFKGIIIPLCASNDCSLREAVIFGSLLARRKIPILASSAAIRIICGMKYTGANSIFLRVLLNKKHALTWGVIDAVCDHFVRFKLEDLKLPVLWHQCLLTFVQRYKEDLSADQKQHLITLTAFHSHYGITPEVRRELENSKCRT